MFIKQLSVFVENKKGRLAEITAILAEKGINIHALSIADTTDFGILRLIVADPGAACAILKSADIMVKETDVLAVSLIHEPGALSAALKALEDNDISIEYMYAFTSRSAGHDAMVILRLNDQEEAVKKLTGAGIKFITPEIIKGLE